MTGNAQRALYAGAHRKNKFTKQKKVLYGSTLAPCKLLAVVMLMLVNWVRAYNKCLIWAPLEPLKQTQVGISHVVSMQPVENPVWLLITDQLLHM